MKERNTLRVETHENRREFARHLRSLAAGLREGRVLVTGADRQVSLRPVEPIEVRATCRSGAAGTSVSVQLTWGHLPPLWTEAPAESLR